MNDKLIIKIDGVDYNAVVNFGVMEGYLRSLGKKLSTDYKEFANLESWLTMLYCALNEGAQIEGKTIPFKDAKELGRKVKGKDLIPFQNYYYECLQDEYEIEVKEDEAPKKE